MDQAVKAIRFPKWEDPPVHPANTAPMMSDAELDELAKDIKKHGLQEPLIYWRDNHEEANGSTGPFPLFLLDGRNRREALKRLGINDPKKAPLGKVVASTMRILDAIKQTNTLGANGKTTSEWVTDCDPQAFHLSLNVYRRHLTAEQRRWEIKRLLVSNPDVSNNSIARKLHVGKETVQGVRFEMTGRTGSIPKATRIAEAIKADPEMSDQEIGKSTDAASSYVNRIRRSTYRLKGQNVSPSKPVNKQCGQATKELAAWIVDRADQSELPTILTWLRTIRIKSVVRAIKAHMGEE